MVTPAGRGVRGAGSPAFQDDAAVQSSRAPPAPATRADPDASGDALESAAQADFLVDQESRHPDAAGRRILC
jgi:hypothetical protein